MIKGNNYFLTSVCILHIWIRKLRNMKKPSIYLLTLCFFLAFLTTRAQSDVIATIQVIPPYSPYLSTYVDQPNKLLLTLTNISRGPLRVKLWVRMSSDNGVSVTTAANFQPSRAIDLGVGEVKNFDFSTPETRDYFDANHVDLTGLTKAQLIQNQALPEGNYSICVRVLDYNAPNTLRSMDACANIPVSYIDPPMAIQPACGNTVNASTPQNIIFNWTPPATASGVINYEFTLKEVPNTLNPNDVIKNSAFPVLFNTTLTGANVLVYTNANPALEEGRKYVWRVKSVDPLNSVQFKNNGFSEACWFKYDGNNIPVFNPNIAPTSAVVNNINMPKDLPPAPTTMVPFVPIVTENQGTIFMPAFVMASNVKGKLTYKYQGGAKQYPMIKATISLVVDYVFNNNKSPQESVPLGGIFNNIPAGQEIAVTTTDMDGNFNFTYTDPMKFGEVASDFRWNVMEGDVRYGKVYRCAYLKITSAHQEFYVQPSTVIYPVYGDLKDIGDIVTNVLAGKLTVTVKRSGSAGDFLQNSSINLAGANVYLARKKFKTFSDLMTFPQEDGAPDNEKKAPAALSDLEIVGKAETNDKGEATFTKMVDHDNPNYRYYIYADFNEDGEGYVNYKMFSGAKQVMYNPDKEGSSGISFNIRPGVGLQYYQTITMYGVRPKIRGVLLDSFGLKPLNGIVKRTTLYFGTNNDVVDLLGGEYTDEEKELGQKMMYDNCPCALTVNEFKGVGIDGKFEFDMLNLMYNQNTKKIVGPLHLLTGYSLGYKEKTVVAGDNLGYGMQAFREIKMSRGARISGKVKDGDTQKGLTASFHFVGENGSGESLGWFGGFFGNYPAKKLNGTKQKLVFEAEGYLNDTVEVVIDKEQVDIGTVYLYTIDRRLVVIVMDEKKNTIITDAKVEIEEVKTICTYKPQGGGSGGQIQVGNISYECPISQTGGIVSFKFKNGGGQENNGQLYTVHVMGPDGKEYLDKRITTKIPYSNYPKVLTVKLEMGTCLSGHVYAGNNNSSPVAGAKVKMDITEPFYLFGLGIIDMVTGQNQTTTDNNGAFTLHKVPLRSYPQIVRAVKSNSNFVGDSISIVTKPDVNYNVGQTGGYNVNNADALNAGLKGKNNVSQKAPGSNPPAAKDDCINRDFHLTVYNDMDITSLMGFPIEVEQLKPNGPTSARIWGNFVSLPGNNQFKAQPGTTLSFNDVEIIPSVLKNEKGIPVSEPKTLPLTTNQNLLALKLYNTIDGVVEDKKLGIYLDKVATGKQYGVVKGMVKILNTAFSQNIITFKDTICLALPSGTDKLKIPVLNADKTVLAPANAPTGFAISNSSGGLLKMALPGFPSNVTASASSTFFNGELNLNATIHTNIADVSPADLNITINDIKVKKTGNPVIGSTNPVTLNLGSWKLTSTDWSIDANGFKLNNSTLDAGVSVPIKNIGIQSNALLTNNAQVDFGAMKLAGVHPVTMTGGNKTFSLINVSGSVKAWQIAAAADATGTAAKLAALPKLSTPVELKSIRLLSDGSKYLIMRGKTVKVSDCFDFMPTDNAPLTAQTDQFIIPGNFTLNLPGPQTYHGELYYGKSGSSLNFNFINAQPVNFNQPTALHHTFFQGHELTNRLLKIKGTTEEPGLFPKTNTTLYYSPDSVSVWIDNGQNIPISGERKFAKAEGGMRLQSSSWSPFWFDGEMRGMKGVDGVLVNGKPQRMKFVVSGEIAADGSSISMKNVNTPFGNMEWHYDMPNARLTGHCDIDMSVGGIGLNGGINTLVDGAGWRFDIAGTAAIPGVGNANLYGLFGNYPSVPADFSSKMGDFKCLPPSFNGKVDGFLFGAGITKEVVPGQHWDFALCSVDFGVDLSLNGRVHCSFDGPGTTFGIGLLAVGKAYANGSLDVTCTSVKADANAQVSISGDYNTANSNYNINGCASVHFGLEGEQCVGMAGLCCGDCCASVDVGSIDLGAKVSYNNVSGADISLMFHSCNDVCE